MAVVVQQVKEQETGDREDAVFTLSKESIQHERRFRIAKSGCVPGENGRYLHWYYLFGMGVNVFSTTGEMLAHVDLYSMSRWLSPTIVKCKNHSRLLTESEEMSLLNVMESLAEYERKGFHLLGESLDNFLQPFKETGCVIPLTIYFAQKLDIDINTVEISFASYLLQSVMDSHFLGTPHDKAKISRVGSPFSEAWNFTLVRVKSLREDWQNDDEDCNECDEE